MASQQPSQARPWFRLASIRAIPPPSAPSSTPQPDPVPPPRPVIRPAFSQTFRAPPPPPQEPTPLSPPPPVTVTPPPPPPVTVTPPPPPTTPTRSSPPLSRVSPTPPPPRSSPPPPPPITATTTSSMPTSPVIRALAPTSTMTTSPRTLSSSSVPQLPKPKVSSPSSSLPTSPPLKQPINGPLLSSTSPKLTSPSPKLASPFPPQVPATITAHSPNPASSPKTITSLAHSPSSSPKIRSISHPPSPLTLPPAQLRSDTTQSRPQEPEQKNVLVQQTIEKSKLTNTNSNSSHKYVDGTRSPPPVKGNHQVSKDKGKYKKSSDSDDYGMRIITIAGDNKGAIMELSPWRNKHNLKNSPQVWSDGENSGKGKYDEKSPSSYVNSNVQGLNNSIIFNASCTHNDPGVHLSLSRNGNGHRGIHMKDRVIKDY